MVKMVLTRSGEFSSMASSDAVTPPSTSSSRHSLMSRVATMRSPWWSGVPNWPGTHGCGAETRLRG